MNDVAPSGANIQANLLELVCEVLDAAVFLTDKFDCLTFASKRLLKYFPLPESRLQPGTRMRDLFGAIYDCGIRMAPGGEDPLAGMTREEWIADRVAMNWRERHDSIMHLGRDRWVKVVHRRAPNAVGITAFIDISEQKKREIQFRADGERVKLTEDILDNLPAPVFVQDEHLHFVAVNKAFCQLQQTTPDMLIGRSIYDLFAPDLAADFEEAAKARLMTGDGHDALLQMRRPDGSDLTLVAASARIGRPGHHYLANVFVDITAHAGELSGAGGGMPAGANPFAAGLGPFAQVPEFEDVPDFDIVFDDPFDGPGQPPAEAGDGDPFDLIARAGEAVAGPGHPQHAADQDQDDRDPANQDLLGHDPDGEEAPAPVSLFDIEPDFLKDQPLRRVIILAGAFAQGEVLVRHLKGCGHDSCCLHDPADVHAFLDAATAAGLGIDMLVIDGLSTTDWDPDGLKAACLHAGRRGVECHMLPRHPDGRINVDKLDQLMVDGEPAWRPDFLPVAGPLLAEAPPLAPLDPPHAGLSQSRLPEPAAGLARTPALLREEVDVLVVEDNPVNRIVFEQLLDSLSLRHRIVGNASDALSAFKARRPSILFIDLTLPDMDGADLARHIAETDRNGARVPMIAVMSRPDFQAETRALASGMRGVLVKPVSPDMIDALIRDHVLGLAGSPSQSAG